MEFYSCVYKYECNGKKKLKFNQADIPLVIFHECVFFVQPHLGVLMSRLLSCHMRDVILFSIVVFYPWSYLRALCIFLTTLRSIHKTVGSL